MKEKFRSMGEQVWLQETLQAGRGSRRKAFGLPGIDVVVLFVSFAELHCLQSKLTVGAAPLLLFWLVIAHTVFLFMPIIQLRQVGTYRLHKCQAPDFTHLQ